MTNVDNKILCFECEENNLFIVSIITVHQSISKAIS